MKDMSEEKEYCKCTDDVACMPHQVVDGLHAKVKSLESRLKEAQDDLERCHSLWQQEANGLKERLSQAEAENKRLQLSLKRYDKDYCDCTGEKLKDIPCVSHMAYEEVEARLSHLMDVAGKVGVALKAMVDLVHSEYCSGCCEDWHGEADKALAEWDGIKKEGV